MSKESKGVTVLPVKKNKDTGAIEKQIPVTVEVTRIKIERRLPIKYKVLLVLQSLLILGLIIGS